jgi:probable HAF family extracellular repeat protein
VLVLAALWMAGMPAALLSTGTPVATAATTYTITDLGTFPGGNSSYAYGINDSGQVVGYSATADGSGHAFLWQDGTMTDLGTLPGDSVSNAYGINDAGQVIGVSATVSGEPHAVAVLWQNGTMTDLGALLGAPFIAVNGINDAGQVVGWSGGHAVLLTPASSDTIPPVVTVKVPQPTHGSNGWFNAQDMLPINVSVSADASTTGGRTITSVSCTVNNAPVTLGNVTGLNTVMAQGTLAVSAAGTSTIGCTASDSAGDAGATGASNTGVVKIDTQAPSVACPSPAPDFTVNQPGASLTATVTDPSPGAGPDLASGTASASTAQVGSFTVQVTGQDLAGNATTVGCADQVSYKIALLYSKTDNGRPAIILQLQDDNDVNQSAPSIPVTGVSIVDSQGHVVQTLNSPFTFKTNGPAGTSDVYVYKLSTQGLPKGAQYQLLFKAGTDPVIHAVPFTA